MTTEPDERVEKIAVFGTYKIVMPMPEGGVDRATDLVRLDFHQMAAANRAAMEITVCTQGSTGPIELIGEVGRSYANPPPDNVIELDTTEQAN
ncbi:MAG: hypothetical protein R3313_00490 [Candidatus Saccharimonadales bacterium]|nr:hypothetical protein [Candidatus Saccharimonadales bacterium]